VDYKLPFCENEEDYDLVYDTIVNYEGAAMADALLTAKDKKIILITTCVLRYSVYKKRKPKRNDDHDWDINVTHIAGTIESANMGLKRLL
jgi:capsular polysaccharide biosynthesis protein